jgi:hypothetical protein
LFLNNYLKNQLIPLIATLHCAGLLLLKLTKSSAKILDCASGGGLVLRGSTVAGLAAARLFGTGVPLTARW